MLVHKRILAILLCLHFNLSFAQEPTIIVAEGERFEPVDENGWKIIHQDQSYATQTFGGMWATHGGLISAAADVEGAVASQKIVVKSPGSFRVWSKYQSPPYFNFNHQVEIWQNNRKVFSHDYGKLNSERMYSFFGETVYGLPPKKQVWFSWGVDHDAAEAPRKMVRLEKGSAEIRLISHKKIEPAGDRFIDFFLLTTEQNDTCIGWEKHGQAKSPFMFEAIRATPIYFRFKNTASKPAKAKLFTHFGHVTWHCAPKSKLIPSHAVAPGVWSPWININDVVELFTDEGLQVSLVDGELDPKGRAVQQAPSMVSSNHKIQIQIALDSAGKHLLKAMDVPNGETIHFPMDITWNHKQKEIRLSKEIAAELVAKTKSIATKTGWRKASKTKPNYIPIYGSFSRSKQPWAEELKDALGYNTQLSNKFRHMKVDGYFQHLRNEDQIRKYAAKLGADKKNFRVCSLGDEISIGGINFDDPKYIEPFRNWLHQKKLTKDDLLVDPSRATLTANSRLRWYARLFGAEQRFAQYRKLTAAARQEFGPQVLTGANYSPHHGVMYYGDPLQWIDAFKHRAMSMFWTEDYIFFVPELPQTMSFLMARAQCAVKYHQQPIHMYVMPHSPGQPAGYFRRNVLLSIGAGAKHIDHFWVAPQENYSENYVSWQSHETFQAIFETNYDIAAVEPLLVDAKRRRSKIAVVTGKATALNEDDVVVPIAQDKFLKMSHLAGKPVQNICRKDQQLIYLALRQAQFQVDLITEDDIAENRNLSQYKAIYFAGEWFNSHSLKSLTEWVEQGGTLYLSTGLGHLNQYNEKDNGLQELAGIRAEAPRKNLFHHRPLLELPLADVIDSTHADDISLDAIAFRQKINTVSPNAKVLARWKNGDAAITENPVGKGRVYSVGTAMGATFWKTALRQVPWARGGKVNLYNPVDFDKNAWRVMNLGTESLLLDRDVNCSRPSVESLLLDNAKGTLLTLINWTNEESLEEVKVSVKVPVKPRQVFSVTQQKELNFRFKNGRIEFTTQLQEGDFVMILN